MRLRADDIKWLFDNVPEGTRVQFIDQPVKATVEPDGSRYMEIHNPLSTTEEEFKSRAPVPITLTPAVSKIISDASVNQAIVDQAMRTRSGMPVKVNGPAEETPSEPVVPQNADSAAPNQTLPTNAAEQNGNPAPIDQAQPAGQPQTQPAAPVDNDAAPAPADDNSGS